jgi:hypothetical protein
MLLLSALVAAATLAFLPGVWVYHAIHHDLGIDAAETILAFDVVLTLGLVTVGIGMAVLADWMIRRRRFVFRYPQQGSWTETFLKVWGYELQSAADILEPPRPTDPQPDTTAPSVRIDPPHRRGRKPTFPLERWLPIAVQWENRDPIRDAFTLGELIAEHLGTNSDGSPVVSEQTYYSTWRDRAIEELQRRAQSGRKPTGTSAPRQD